MNIQPLVLHLLQSTGHIPELQSLNRTLEARRFSADRSAPPGDSDQSCNKKPNKSLEVIFFSKKQTWLEHKQRLCSHPRQSEMLYVSTESWQTRFHSSAPVRVLQGELSEAPARPRRLDFFLASSPPGVGVKWGTKRQQRKWLTAAERQETSTP